MIQLRPRPDSFSDGARHDGASQPVFSLLTALTALAFALALPACGGEPEAKDKPTATDASAADATSGDDTTGQADTTIDAGPSCPANTCAIALPSGVTCAAAGSGPSPCERCEPGKSTSAWTIKAGATCDDGDACTSEDTCDSKGTCAGEAKSCDDDNPCTSDSCKGGDCQHDFSKGSCDDGDLCTGDGACVSGKCGSGAPKDCDDGDPCSKDTCDAKTGACQSAADPNACDDGNSCTTDSCAPKTGCAHVQLAKGATCSDDDACTRDDACTSTGSCLAGGAVECNDGNPCTTDSCDKKLGCLNLFNNNSCSDGESCTSGDSCSGGLCLGQKTSACKLCKKTFGATAAQLTGFAIGTEGDPTSGLDVDDNPKTCAPKGKCSAGVDNAFSSLAFVLNPALKNAVASGALQFVADFNGFAGPGKFFKLNLYYATLSPGSQSKGCKPQSEPCGWIVSQQAFTAACTPRVSFNDAKLVGTQLTAGGPGTVFAMEVSLAGGDATFLVKGARLKGTLILAKDGKTVTKFTGVIGGSMTEKAILSTFQGLPDSAFAPLTKSGAMALVKTLLVLDIDADGDGKPESTSVGLKVTALGASLEGLAKQ